MDWKLFACILTACGLCQAQSYTYVFRQTLQPDQTVLTEPHKGDPPTGAVDLPLVTTWNDTCLPDTASTSYREVTLAFDGAGALTTSERVLQPGWTELTISITPLAPPAGFTPIAIMAEVDGSTGAPLVFAASKPDGSPDVDAITKAAAGYLAQTWPSPASCRNVRLRWVAGRRYLRDDTLPNQQWEWHVAVGTWPVSAVIALR